MKIILLILAVSFSANLFASERDPNYCQGDDSCETGKYNPFKRNVLYARGYGHSRKQAVKDSEQQFKLAFPGQRGSCGIFSGPYNYGTYDLGDGTFASWTICPIGSNSSSRPVNRSGCAMIFGAIVCR